VPKSVIAYDKELPEIADRRPWEPPTSFLVKDTSAPSGWREDTSGRRPSRLLLVPKIRAALGAWRAGGYEGASDVARRLFEYWFDEDHDVPELGGGFRYWFCQREAIEALVWLVEIAGTVDTQDLIRTFATLYDKDLFEQNIAFQTTMDGKRQLRRYVPELEADGLQDLPPKDLRRYAFKMATGSGKTWVMAMAIIWAHFHKKRVPGSPLSTNFLIVAPNVIVYQRLARDFASNEIFYRLPLIPPEWRGSFSQKVILRGEAAEPDPSANLFLTNIQQLDESRDEPWTPANAVEALLGKQPTKDLAASGQRSMLDRVKSLKDLVILIDEAHHYHDEEKAWSQWLFGIHQNAIQGLSLWLDFSATPKDQDGMYYPWTVCDYPLAQAVEDRIVKAPLIVTKEDDPKQPKDEPDAVTAENIGEKYGYWLRAAVARWKVHRGVYARLGIQPVLFIMAEKNVYADAIGAYLWKTKEFGFKESEVLIIHTDDKTGEIKKKDLERAREAARRIDEPESKVKAIVSVMMLREGWDVRNVTIVLGLRPFTAKAEILPEQVIGRGLRRMPQVGPDRTQTLEVLGTRNLLNVLRDQLEAEGVGVGSTKGAPVQPITVEPIKERAPYDIAIPLTKPSLTHDIRRLAELDVATLGPIFSQSELAEPFQVTLRLQFALTESELGQVKMMSGCPSSQETIAAIANKTVERAKLTNCFADVYPIVKAYVERRCFGKRIDADLEVVRSHLGRLEIREAIAKYLAREIAGLTVERREIEFDKAHFHLSETRPFHWRRNLPPLVAKHTVFNFVATYNDYERRFAQFLDDAKDVHRFASLGTTEQGESGTQFRIDYLKPSGAIGFYHPDWVVVQKVGKSEVNWIIETKGRVWEGTAAKDEAIETWCQRVGAATGTPWKYCRVDQSVFDGAKKDTLAGLITRCRDEGRRGLGLQ
jgi:type III restriction enzyme